MEGNCGPGSRSSLLILLFSSGCSPLPHWFLHLSSCFLRPPWMAPRLGPLSQRWHVARPAPDRPSISQFDGIRKGRPLVSDAKPGPAQAGLATSDLIIHWWIRQLQLWKISGHYWFPERVGGGEAAGRRARAGSRLRPSGALDRGPRRAPRPPAEHAAS